MNDYQVSPHTTRLFAMPSYAQGVARLFDFAGALNTYNISDTPDNTDYDAILSDWYAIGEDLKRAVKLYEQEKAKE